MRLRLTEEQAKKEARMIQLEIVRALERCQVVGAKVTAEKAVVAAGAMAYLQQVVLQNVEDAGGDMGGAFTLMADVVDYLRSYNSANARYTSNDVGEA